MNEGLGASGDVSLKTKVIAVGIMVFCVMIAGGVLVFAKLSAAPARAEPLPVVTSTPAAAPPQKSAEERFAERVFAASTLPEALVILKPIMADAMNTDDHGARALVAWSTLHMKLADVMVAKDETSYALTQKDSDVARGKRLCATGLLVEITKRRVGNDKYFDGLLSTYGGSLFRFYAVGSTGELVERSQARFCGVVTGLFDYANSGGGTGHAVAIVGMFDIAENRPAIAKGPQRPAPQPDVIRAGEREPEATVPSAWMQ